MAIGDPCTGVTSTGPCRCETGYVEKKRREGEFDVCVTCTHTAQVHRIKPEQAIKVKR